MPFRPRHPSIWRKMKKLWSSSLGAFPRKVCKTAISRSAMKPGDSTGRFWTILISPSPPAPYLSPKTFAPFAIVQKSHGFIPNFFRAQTFRPDLLEAELEAVGRILLPEDALTRVQKQCILLAVSAANLNSYCVAMHCNLLRGLGMPSEEGDQIAVDHHEST